MGVLTTYVFVATSVFLVKMLIKGKKKTTLELTQT